MGSVWVLPPVVALSWAASMTSRLRLVNFSTPNWLMSQVSSMSRGGPCKGPLRGLSWSSPASTREKLSRFPSRLGMVAGPQT